MRLFQNLLVGLLFAGSLAMVAHYTVNSQGGPFADKGERMILFFDNAAGVVISSDVFILGVKSGEVKDVSLVWMDKNNRLVPSSSELKYRRKAAVTIELRQKVTFFENYKISIVTQSLIANRSIFIDPGAALDRRTGKTYKQVDIFRVTTLTLENDRDKRTALEYALAGRSLNPDVISRVDLRGLAPKDPIESFTAMLAENRKNINRALRDIYETTDKVKGGQGDIGKLIMDDELYRNVGILLADSEVLIRDWREQLQDAREQEPVNSFFGAAATGLSISN